VGSKGFLSCLEPWAHHEATQSLVILLLVLSLSSRAHWWSRLLLLTRPWVGSHLFRMWGGLTLSPFHLRVPVVTSMSTRRPSQHPVINIHKVPCYLWTKRQSPTLNNLSHFFWWVWISDRIWLAMQLKQEKKSENTK
jgi:hypothetical protein